MKIIQDAINHSLLHAVHATWPDVNWNGWHHYSGQDAEKYGTRSARDLSPLVTSCLYQMVEVASQYVEFGCFPDMELHGAGMHMLCPGGYLRKHLDSSVMESTGWKREYSCVLGVNPVWREQWGGRFVLDHTPSVPLFNQMVIFRTTENAYHWVEEVIGPEPRCTLAVFFWSKREPADPSRTSARFTT